VYFLHNRVQTIRSWELRVRELMPEATVAVAHGQMSPTELEEVMYRFARGDTQVLVATAIIENGLDIPNVNTIIVNDAWRFGLAQLYQLRGRVGRAATQAYAYFLYRKDHILTEESQKRLQTILEASELGAGFRIAMRDLEIRGAGNLLGTEQHGHISAVGFDLYTRLLAAAVERLRGREPEPVGGSPVVVDLPLDAYLPDEYMGSYATKVREYQRLARLSGIDEAEEAIADIRDRFGEFPPPVENLAYLLRVKVRAHALGFPAVTTYGRELIVRLPPDYQASIGVVRKTIGRGMRQGHAGLVWADFEHDREWPEKLLSLLDGLVRWEVPAPAVS
jgi:transcription-repair coupling factor (superfamily II helicase)